jgi:hypothetical protein
MSSEKLSFTTFNINILNDIEKSAVELYDEIHKVNNVLSGLLNIDCTNYNMITIEYINKIKDNFIDNFDIFVSNLETIYFADLGEYSVDQLIQILSSNDLEIFKLKHLLTKELNEHLSNTEKELYEYSYNKLINTYTMNKITFYQDIYNNPIIKDFLNKINNIEKIYQQIDNNISYEEYNNNNNTVNFDENELENLIKNICDINNLEYSNLTEMKYTLWNDKVQLYEIKNKKTYDFLYIYFDLYKREDKIEKENILYFDTKLKKICICYNFNNLLTDKEYNEFKNIIYNIIKTALP